MTAAPSPVRHPVSLSFAEVLLCVSLFVLPLFGFFCFGVGPSLVPVGPSLVPEHTRALPWSGTDVWSAARRLEDHLLRPAPRRLPQLGGLAEPPVLDQGAQRCDGRDNGPGFNGARELREPEQRPASVCVFGREQPSGQTGLALTVDR
eukprot:3149356-Rhodomonas_salina.2